MVACHIGPVATDVGVLQCDLDAFRQIDDLTCVVAHAMRDQAHRAKKLVVLCNECAVLIYSCFIYSGLFLVIDALYQ